LTSQEILSYPAPHKKGCFRKEVCVGIRNRGTGPQLTVLDRQSRGRGIILNYNGLVGMRKFGLLILLICICCSQDDNFHAISKKIVKNEPDFYVLDPVVGFIHKSNANRYYVWPEHNDGHITLKTNNLGFREDTDTITDKHDKIRVLFTGDSHISGVVNNSESCCTVLEDLLNQAVNGTRYEVINSGVGYYFPHNYLGIIKKYLYLAPDFFIVTLYVGNNFLKTCAFIGCQRSNDLEYKVKLQKVQSFNPGGLWQGLNQIYYFKLFPEFLEISLKAVMDDFHSIKEICDFNNIKLIVLLLPSKIEIEWPTDELRLNKCKELLNLTDADLQINMKLLEKLSAQLNSDKIDYLNLYDYLKNKDRKLFWNEDYHLNDYGHQILAETLFAKYKDIFFKVRKAKQK